MVIVRLSLGLSFSGCEISSKISNYVMMRNLAPGDLVKKAWDLCNQDWPGCSMMNVMHLKVIVFWGGPYRFSVFRACTKSFSTPPYQIGRAGYFDRCSYGSMVTTPTGDIIRARSLVIFCGFESHFKLFYCKTGQY